MNAKNQDLVFYYKRLFPYGPFFRWLSYGNVQKSYFQNREFSFTLKDDIYIRYQSFANQEEMEKEIRETCPNKIDIGAVYSHRPKNHKIVTGFQAEEKELVFDIDMTDYDDVRTCCGGTDICQKCWKFLAIAVKIIDAALREDFGFRHLLWVYSGRRGVHCWVCDPEARKLGVSARGAVAEYIQIVCGKGPKCVFLPGSSLHPSIQRAIEIIKPYFIMFLEEQDILENKEACRKILQLITSDDLRKIIEGHWKSGKYVSAEDRWNILEVCCLQGDYKRKGHHFPAEEIMLQYTYPRLDIAVSKGLNHLLKAPFCVHPKTERICIPFEAKNVDKFLLDEVPTVSDLVKDIEQYTNADNVDSPKKIKDYKKTRLYESVKILEQLVRQMECAWKGKHIEKSDAMQDF